ncbi:Delta-aminolevulinic acid dehydratase OS=Streptomyces alboniger OX=132473 GN=hemB PE=3 SV=1 [Streptomyces alboniger]
MLYGVPEESKKDAAGTVGTDPDCILQLALRDVAAEVGDDLIVMSDLCLERVHRPRALRCAGRRRARGQPRDPERYAEMAQVQADVGAHVVAPAA